MEIIFNSGRTNAVIICAWICTLPLILCKESVFKVWYTHGLLQEVTLWFPAFAAANLNSKPNLHWYSIQSVWNVFIRTWQHYLWKLYRCHNEMNISMHVSLGCAQRSFSFSFFLKANICWILGHKGHYFSSSNKLQKLKTKPINS